MVCMKITKGKGSGQEFEEKHGLAVIENRFLTQVVDIVDVMCFVGGGKIR